MVYNLASLEVYASWCFETIRELHLLFLNFCLFVLSFLPFSNMRVFNCQSIFGLMSYNYSLPKIKLYSCNGIIYVIIFLKLYWKNLSCLIITTLLTPLFLLSDSCTNNDPTGLVFVCDCLTNNLLMKFSVVPQLINVHVFCPLILLLTFNIYFRLLLKFDNFILLFSFCNWVFSLLILSSQVYSFNWVSILLCPFVHCLILQSQMKWPGQLQWKHTCSSYLLLSWLLL